MSAADFNEFAIFNQIRGRKCIVKKIIIFLEVFCGECKCELPSKYGRCPLNILILHILIDIILSCVWPLTLLFLIFLLLITHNLVYKRQLFLVHSFVWNLNQILSVVAGAVGKAAVGS